MPGCFYCGEGLTNIPEKVTESFPCVHCGNQLQATLRCRSFFLAAGAALAVALRLATLNSQSSDQSAKNVSIPVCRGRFVDTYFLENKPH